MGDIQTNRKTDETHSCVLQDICLLGLLPKMAPLKDEGGWIHSYRICILVGRDHKGCPSILAGVVTQKPPINEQVTRGWRVQDFPKMQKTPVQKVWTRYEVSMTQKNHQPGFSLSPRTAPLLQSWPVRAKKRCF